MKPIVVQGQFRSPTHLELDEPVVVSDPAVEVVIRAPTKQRRPALLALLARMAARPARGRTQEDIDRQLAADRETSEFRR